MTKVVNDANQIWHQVNGDRVNIGLTREFLNTLDECWHILPGGRVIKAKAPLMTIETNDSLVSILSPVAGTFIEFNARATNFPDKLTEHDVVMTLTTARQAARAPDSPVGGDPFAEPVRPRGRTVAERAVDELRVRARLQETMAQLNGERPRANTAGAVQGRNTTGTSFFSQANWTTFDEVTPAAPEPDEPF